MIFFKINKEHIQKPATKTHRKHVSYQQQFGLRSRAKHESKHGNKKATVELRLMDGNTKAWVVNTTNEERLNRLFSLISLLQCKLRMSEMGGKILFSFSN